MVRLRLSALARTHQDPSAVSLLLPHYGIIAGSLAVALLCVVIDHLLVVKLVGGLLFVAAGAFALRGAWQTLGLLHDLFLLRDVCVPLGPKERQPLLWNRLLEVFHVLWGISDQESHYRRVVKAHLEVYAAEEEMLSAVRRNAELVRDIERFRAEARELRGAAVDESLLDQYAARVKLIEGMYRKINATEAALRPVLGGAKAAAVAEQLEQQLELALSAGPELFAEGKGHGM